MSRFSKKREGKLLSTSYKNSKEPLRWQCKYKHKFNLSYVEVAHGKSRLGTWCNICSSGISERICRHILESIFKRKFPKSYPEWLVNIEGNRMELDGYCKSLKIAFEHHGDQHYQMNSHFMKTKDKLDKRRRDDNRKRNLCKKHGVKLIEIDQIGRKTPLENICDIMQIKLDKLKIKKNVKDYKFDFDKAMIGIDKLEEYKKKTQSLNRKVTVISKSYLGSQVKIKHKCNKCKHEFMATPNAILCNRVSCQTCNPSNKTLGQNFLDFNEARLIIHGMRIENRSEWRMLTKNKLKEKNFRSIYPKHPNNTIRIEVGCHLVTG